jgi:hypothetical protein
MNSKPLKKSWFNYGIEESIPLSAPFYTKLRITITNYIRCDILCRLYDYYHMRVDQVKRMYAYALHGKYSYDFDAHSIYSLVQFKLKRVRRELIDGHAIHTDDEIQALDRAIRLCGRLHRDKYDSVYYRQHEKKWGKLQSKTNPIVRNDIQYYEWISWRPNANTEEEKQQELEEHLQLYSKGVIMIYLKNI